MYKNEDPLDSLFQKTADHLKVNFEERDWDRMSRMLDEDDHRRDVRRKVFGVSIITAIAGLSFVLIEKISTHHEADLKGHPLMSSKTVESKIQAEKIEKRMHAVKTEEAEETLIKKEDNRRKAATKRLRRNVTTVKATFSNKPIENRISIENSIVGSTRLPIRRWHKNSLEQAKAAQLNEPSIEQKDSATSTPLTAEIEKVRDESEKKPRAEKLPWSAALVFAPDFSSVNMKEYTSPGQTAGVIAFCPLSSKLALGAGFMQSRKVYSANGADYNVPTGYWDRYTNGVVPENISASCTIMEMSLQMRYQKTLHRSNVHAMAGVSSYYMYNESYQYSFTTQPYGSTGFNSDESSMYMFKVASVSVGYERYLSPYLLVGVEPYMKLPMAEMGWSNVKLFSAGMFLTLRYSFKRSEQNTLNNNQSPLDKKL
jgi:hypothetical protein